MAAVKTQKASGGPRLQTRWKGAICSLCAKEIDGLNQAWRVQSISYGPRRDRMVWQHRTCQGAK